MRSSSWIHLHSMTLLRQCSSLQRMLNVSSLLKLIVQLKLLVEPESEGGKIQVQLPRRSTKVTKKILRMMQLLSKLRRQNLSRNQKGGLLGAVLQRKKQPTSRPSLLVAHRPRSRKLTEQQKCKPRTTGLSY